MELQSTGTTLFFTFSQVSMFISTELTYMTHQLKWCYMSKTTYSVTQAGSSVASDHQCPAGVQSSFAS
jgi:hypothetical protein